QTAHRFGIARLVRRIPLLVDLFCPFWSFLGGRVSGDCYRESQRCYSEEKSNWSGLAHLELLWRFESNVNDICGRLETNLKWSTRLLLGHATPRAMGSLAAVESKQSYGHEGVGALSKRYISSVGDDELSSPYAPL